MTRPGDAGLLAVVAVGGVLGSLGRYAVGLALPHPGGAFAWSTLFVNVTGSLAMGLLMAWVWSTEQPHPWLRPFLGVGVLGGWTTFSTYALDAHAMLEAGRDGPAAAYIVGSLVGSLAAVTLGVAGGRAVTGQRP